jgi:Aspartate racemase
MKPIVGVLGGMGPAATILFLDRLVRFATASIDQDHLKSVVMMNCDIPDRSSAIIRKDDGPLIAMVEGLTNLEKSRRRLYSNSVQYSHVLVSTIIGPHYRSNIKYHSRDKPSPERRRR